MSPAGTSRLGLALLLGAALWALAEPSLATEGQSTTQAADSQASGAGTSTADADGRSGYSAGPPPLENQNGVESDLYEDDKAVGSVFKIKALSGVLDPWWNTKKEINEKVGLKLQVTYQSLREWTDQDDPETYAAGGRFQFQGAWTVIGRKSKNPSVITFRMEYRDTLDADIPPSKLGGQFGSAGLVGTGFSDFQFQFRELAWRQTLYKGRWKFGGGKISAVSWYNGHALSTPMRGFQNTALMASNTRTFPGRGLGVVSGVRVGQRWAVITGIHDANAVSADNPFDTIGEGEFLYSAEVRYFPTTFDRHQWDQVRLQIWHQDEREEAGVPPSSGATFVVSRLFQDRFMPFLFGGKSDGDASQMETDLGGGIGIGFKTRHRAAQDVLGIGLNWGKPSNPSRQEQWTSEIFYRFQLLQNIAFTPSAQYIQDPLAGEPGQDVWVFGFRWRMTF